MCFLLNPASNIVTKSPQNAEKDEVVQGGAEHDGESAEEHVPGTSPVKSALQCYFRYFKVDDFDEDVRIHEQVDQPWN